MRKNIFEKREESKGLQGKVWGWQQAPLKINDFLFVSRLAKNG
jgi:hypothetical protein